MGASSGEEARWERYRPGEWPRLKSALATDWPPNQKLLRGYRISDLIRASTFSDSIFLSLFGRLPDPRESRMFDAILISSNSGTYASSGSMAARYIVSTSESTQAAMAGGLLAFGFRHGAACDAIAQMLQEGMRRKAQGPAIEETAAALVREYRASGRRLPGLGSAFYSEDPRTVALFELAQELGFFGDYCRLMQALAQSASQRGKKGLVVNEEGAAVAILCDMLGDDYDWRASNIWHLIGRLPSVAGAALEELQRAKPDDRRVPWEYDGPPERDLPPGYHPSQT